MCVTNEDLLGIGLLLGPNCLTILHRAKTRKMQDIMIGICKTIEVMAASLTLS